MEITMKHITKPQAESLATKFALPQGLGKPYWPMIFNEVIQRYIDGIKNRSRLVSAVATLTMLGYTDEGGSLWKPPTGKAPDFSLIDSLRAEVEVLQARVAELTAESEHFSKSYGLLAVEHCAALVKLAAQAQPLTDGEIHTAYIEATNQTLRPQDERLALLFARAIEKAHGIGGSV
jgi:hypothetical protein